MTATDITARPATAMNRWRLEWLRLTRSPRGFAVICLYVFFGLAGPLLARYMAQLAKHASSGVTILAPEPRPEHGIVNYINQASQTGMIVLIVVAAGIFAMDAHRGLATFYRTRVPGTFRLMWPRLVATACLAITAYVAGTAAAWLETALVLGRLPVAPVLWGVVLEAVFLVFAVVVVMAASTVARGTLATAGIALVVLLVVLPLAGMVRGVGAWLPTRLLTAPAGLVTDAAAHDYVRAVAVTVAATAALLLLAVYRADRREL